MAITKIQTRALVAAVTDDITANSAKTGITSGQASAITANTAKVTNSTSASDLTSGTLPDAAFPSTLPAASGANLTALPAANITGTLPAISGAALTNVPAANITGTLPALNGSALTGIAGRKNLIINGGMQVAQRGTSSTGNGYVSLDRWYSNQSGASTTFSQETNTSPSETGGIKSYARLNVSSSSNYTGIRQRIEDVTSVPSGIVTLSFWAKGTAPVGGLYMYSGQDFGTGGSGDVDIAGILITSSLTSSWVKYSTQITIPSVDGKTIGAGSFFNLAINQGTNTSSTAYDLNITGVQLELGSVATDFEHRSYGEELQLCQRYYQYIGVTPDSSSQMIIWTADVTSGSGYYTTTALNSVMRANPTVVIVHSANDGFSGGVSVQALSKHRIRWVFTSSSTQQRAYVQWNYTADAEL